jgi:uncharacterized protein YceK
LILAFIVLLFSGCSGMSQTSSNTEEQSQAYNTNSWKTMIPDSCLSFFDGCNNCRRSAAGEVAACTRKACFKYQKPRCLDNVK